MWTLFHTLTVAAYESNGGKCFSSVCVCVCLCVSDCWVFSLLFFSFVFEFGLVARVASLVTVATHAACGLSFTPSLLLLMKVMVVSVLAVCVFVPWCIRSLGIFLLSFVFEFGLQYVWSWVQNPD